MVTVRAVNTHSPTLELSQQSCRCIEPAFEYWPSGQGLAGEYTPGQYQLLGHCSSVLSGEQYHPGAAEHVTVGADVEGADIFLTLRSVFPLTGSKKLLLRTNIALQSDVFYVS